MRGSWTAGLVALGLLGSAACGGGSDARDAVATSVAPVTLAGIGNLPDTVPPTVVAPPSSSSTTTTVDEAHERGEIALGALDGDPYIADPGNDPELDDPRVLLVGDSVLEATTAREPDDLDRYVAALGWHVWVDAQRGRHLPQAVAAIRGFADGPSPWTGTEGPMSTLIPESVVLMLGNNFSGDRDEFRASLDEMFDLLVDAKRIVMFTVPVWRPMQQAVNELLREAARREPRLVLIDWQKMTEEIDGVLQSDGLHPTDDGARYLAQEIGRVLGPAPGVPFEVELPVLGEFSDELLPAWVPAKARETVPPPVTGVTSASSTTITVKKPRPTTTAMPDQTSPPSSSP